MKETVYCNRIFSFLQLQDLAVSPSIRDPQLNSAECVTEGHKPDILATGHSERIIAILCCSCLFAVLSGPLLALYVMHYQENRPKIERWTMHVLCVGLIVIFLSLFIYCIILAIKEKPKEKFLHFIHAIYPLIAGVGFVVGGCTCWICHKSVKWYAMLYVICANLTAYHFCWLLVGIMLNPTWGLAVLLIICLVIGVFTFTVFTFLSSVYESNGNTSEDQQGDNSKHGYQSFFSCLAAFLAVCCLIVVVILAGQSYHGRQTADEVLKDGILYLISVSFSWLYWKHYVSKNSSPTSQHQPGDTGNLTGYRPVSTKMADHNV